MTELVRTGNVSYARYGELLLQRDKLRKEAFLYQRKYVREFGALIMEVFNQKMECIRKKKTIEFCQAAKNRGQNVDVSALREYLDKELDEMRKQLGRMAEDYAASQKYRFVTESDLLEIKRIYRRLAKRMHPDMTPEVAGSEELTDLWNRINVAYNCNDLKELQELEVLAMKALEELGAGASGLEIENIDGKIEELEEEMETIRSTDPYAYRYILEDPKAVEDKKRDLKEELASFEAYAAQLDALIAELGINAGDAKWRMN